MGKVRRGQSKPIVIIESQFFASGYGNFYDVEKIMRSKHIFEIIAELENLEVQYVGPIQWQNYFKLKKNNKSYIFDKVEKAEITEKMSHAAAQREKEKLVKGMSKEGKKRYVVRNTVTPTMWKESIRQYARELFCLEFELDECDAALVGRYYYEKYGSNKIIAIDPGSKNVGIAYLVKGDVTVSARREVRSFKYAHKYISAYLGK